MSEGSWHAVETGTPGLWRWTAPHPGWRPGMGGPGGWEQDVASVAYERDDLLVLIDPLVRDDRGRERLDALASGRRISILLTAPWHERSAPELRERLGASVGGAVAGVTALPLRGADEGEVAYHLPEHGALVVAEALVGTPAGLRVCRTPALRSEQEWRGWLHELLELDVERVLPAHGPPVLERGRDAIAAALERPDWNSER